MRSTIVQAVVLLLLYWSYQRLLLTSQAHTLLRRLSTLFVKLLWSTSGQCYILGKASNTFPQRKLSTNCSILSYLAGLMWVDPFFFIFLFEPSFNYYSFFFSQVNQADLFVIDSLGTLLKMNVRWNYLLISLWASQTKWVLLFIFMIIALLLSRWKKNNLHLSRCVCVFFFSFSINHSIRTKNAFVS